MREEHLQSQLAAAEVQGERVGSETEGVQKKTRRESFIAKKISGRRR